MEDGEDGEHDFVHILSLINICSPVSHLIFSIKGVSLLYDSVSKHGIGDLEKACYIGPKHIVTLFAIGL